MRRNVTIAFLPEEYLRLQGRAAIAQMPMSTYIKWLLDAAAGAQGKQLDLILERLDQLAAALAKRGGAPALEQPQRASGLPATDVITGKLRERGIPTSTIRQVMTVLQDLGAHS
jgi:hypothetical protein